MEAEYVSALRGENLRRRAALMAECGLDADENVDFTVLLWDDGELAAAGSRRDNILKCIAVSEAHQGEGLAATLFTELRREAFSQGIRHLFLYTKPKNLAMFRDLFFYPVAQTESVLLMENEKDGVSRFAQSIEKAPQGAVCGAAVMNCNPFTFGHRYLIEKAAAECDFLYVFVLSEEKSMFPADDRLALVRAGTGDIKNLLVCKTGPYMVSSATFPSYFIKDKSGIGEIKCRLDIEIFAEHFARRLNIKKRFVGTEPLSYVTAQYNRALLEYLPRRGISVCELERKTDANGEPISASRVRALLGKGAERELSALVPETTLGYLKEKNLI